MKTLLIGCGFLALLGVDNMAFATGSEQNCCSKLISSTPAAPVTAQKNDAADPAVGDTTAPVEGDVSSAEASANNDASGDDSVTDEAAADDSSAAEAD